MKKTVSLLLLAVLCLGLCACGGGSGGAGLGAAAWEKAYYLDAFNDPTEEYYIGTAKRLSGSYSNGSVTDGKLEAELRVDAEKISVYLYENGNDLVKNSGITGISFSVLMKTADGSKTQLYGGMASGGDCVEIWEYQTGSILHFADAAPEDAPVAKALCAKNGEVSFYLTREDQPATSYLFAVKTGNFAALYEAEIVPPIQEAAYAKAEALRSLSVINPIAAGWRHTIGLKADGSVVAVGWNGYGQCENSGWTDIVAVAAGGDHTVGLKADGTVVAVGRNTDLFNDYCGQCEVSGWTDIRLP